MKKIYNMIGVFALALLVFAGCPNPFAALDVDNNSNNSFENNGAVRIFIGDNNQSSRTIQPGQGAIIGYQLTFNPERSPVNITAGNFADVAFDDGEWTITATAYKLGGTIGEPGDAIASGSITINVENGASDDSTLIILRPIVTAAGDGKLDYSITIDSNVSGYVKLFTIDGITPISSFHTNGELTVSNSVNSEFDLPAGRYIIEVRLTNAMDRVAFRRDVIEIWEGTTTVFEFAPDVFVNPDAVLTNSGAMLSEIDSKINGTVAIGSGTGSGISEQNAKTYTFSTPNVTNVSISLIFEIDSNHTTVSWVTNTGNAPNGVYPNSGLPSSPINFSTDNVLWVKVVSEDESTTMFYKFVITPPLPPSNGSFTDTDYQGGFIAGNITWTRPNNLDGIYSYRIYFGINENTRWSTSPIHATASAFIESFSLPRTELPSGVKYFLIYSRSETSDYPDCLAIPIVDLAMAPTNYGAFNVTGTNASGISWNSPNLTITQSGTYYIIGNGSQTTDRIRVMGSDITVNIVLDNVNINVSGTDGAVAFDANVNNSEGVTVNLTLQRTNTFRSGNNRAGLRVSPNTTLVITDDSTGSLNATGGNDGAGIGGNNGEEAGAIIINNGTITANGNSAGTGIGGGRQGNGGIINITGGTITATGGENGAAGIGGGTRVTSIESTGNGSILNITGGIVTANGGVHDGPGIGSGRSMGDAGTINVQNNAVLFASSIEPDLVIGENVDNSIVFINNSGTMYGNVTLNQNVTFGNALTLTIDNGDILVIPSGISLTNNGIILIEDGDIIGTVTGNQPARWSLIITGDSNYTYTGGVLTITGDGSYNIRKRSDVTSTIVDRIVVNPWVNANITLTNVNIDMNISNDTSAFEMHHNSTVNLTLAGVNVLRSGTNRAGLQVHSSSTLVITEASTGSLEAIGGNRSAGIGGGNGGAGGTINILGGVVIATGRGAGWDNGAGIGGGFNGGSGTIAVNNAVAFATSIPATLNAGDNLNNSIVFIGNTGTMYGDVTLTQNITFQTNHVLTIMGGKLTIPNHITLTNNGTIRNMGGTITGSENITGNGSIIGIPPDAIPSNGSFTDTDYEQGKIGGTINWEIPSNTGGITGYRIYWGQTRAVWGGEVIEKLPGNTSVLFTIDTPLATSHTVPEGTVLPSGARWFLIYSYNENGDSSNFLTVSIIDAIELDDAYGSLTVTGNGSVSYSSNVLTIDTNGDYTISGNSTNTRIRVASGLTDVNVTISDLNINVSAFGNTSAFDITDAVVNLTLEGINVLRSGGNRAGLQVPQNATLLITAESNGSLEAFGGTSGAGIGGASGEINGTITIEGGSITATGGNGSNGASFNSGTTQNSSGGTGGGAGIGGGADGSGGIITINNGVITAIAGVGMHSGGAAGIGGGSSGGGSFGNGGVITINGGIVTAVSANDGAGIGGGNYGSGGTIAINGGTVITESGTYETGIGGGRYGANHGTFSMNGNAVVHTSSIGDTDESQRLNGILFIGNVGKFYGTNVSLADNVTIKPNRMLTIPSGAVLTIPTEIKLTNNGIIENDGTIDNNGTITNNGVIDNNGDIDNNGGNINSENGILSGEPPTGGTVIEPVGDKITAVLPISGTSITVTPSQALKVNEVVIIALYDGGRLLEMVQRKQGESLTNIPLTQLGNANTIKVMWWDSMNTMCPICDNDTLTKSGGVWGRL
jgi:hypothetical protein